MRISSTCVHNLVSNICENFQFSSVNLVSGIFENFNDNYWIYLVSKFSVCDSLNLVSDS